MRSLLPILLAALCVSPAGAVGPQHLVCRETRVVQVDPSTLKAGEHASTAVYRLEQGKLYVKKSGEAEYLYGVVTEPEPDRLVSGHKTIHLQRRPDGRVIAQLTHVYKDEVRVSLAECGPR